MNCNVTSDVPPESKKSVCEWNPLSCVLNLDTKLGEHPNWNASIKVSLLLHLVVYEEPDSNELGWPSNLLYLKYDSS